MDESPGISDYILYQLQGIWSSWKYTQLHISISADHHTQHLEARLSDLRVVLTQMACSKPIQMGLEQASCVRPCYLE